MLRKSPLGGPSSQARTCGKEERMVERTRWEARLVMFPAKLIATTPVGDRAVVTECQNSVVKRREGTVPPVNWEGETLGRIERSDGAGVGAQ